MRTSRVVGRGVADLVCCHLCHRYRKPEKMDGTRCIDRDGCRKAMLAWLNRDGVPKYVLRRQYGRIGPRDD